MLRTLIILFTAVCLVACTSMQPVRDSQPQSIREQVKVGDEVLVTGSNGKSYLLVLTQVDDEKIVGSNNGKKWSIRYEQIASLEVRRFSGGKTAGLTGGILAVVYVAMIVAGAYAIKALADSFSGDSDK